MKRITYDNVIDFVDAWLDTLEEVGSLGSLSARLNSNPSTTYNRYRSLTGLGVDLPPFKTAQRTRDEIGEVELSKINQHIRDRLKSIPRWKVSGRYCANGHELTRENTFKSARNNILSCKACASDRARRSRLKRKEQQ